MNPTKYLRKLLGLTQKDLAERTISLQSPGEVVSIQYIKRIEAGTLSHSQELINVEMALRQTNPTTYQEALERLRLHLVDQAVVNSYPHLDLSVDTDTGPALSELTQDWRKIEWHKIKVAIEDSHMGPQDFNGEFRYFQDFMENFLANVSAATGKPNSGTQFAFGSILMVHHALVHDLSNRIRNAAKIVDTNEELGYTDYEYIPLGDVLGEAPQPSPLGTSVGEHGDLALALGRVGVDLEGVLVPRP